MVLMGKEKTAPGPSRRRRLSRGECRWVCSRSAGLEEGHPWRSWANQVSLSPSPIHRGGHRTALEIRLSSRPFDQSHPIIPRVVNCLLPNVITRGLWMIWFQGLCEKRIIIIFPRVIKHEDSLGQLSQIKQPQNSYDISSHHCAITCLSWRRHTPPWVSQL
jgi:hypothetical protein